MNFSKQTIKQTALATAMATALGVSTAPEQASAAQLTFSFTGWFTMINAGGTGNLNNGDSTGAPYYGNRTPVAGTLIIDDATNSGSMTIDPFSFFGSGNASATTISFVDTDGAGGAGTQLLGNMGFNWNGNLGIPVSMVFEGQGLLNAIGAGLTVGDTVGTSGTDFFCDTTSPNITCGTPATDGFLFSNGKSSYTLPIGATPIATTTFNTTDIGTVALGTNPSGTLPLTDDGIGGSPMKAGPFPGFNANFDFDNMTLVSDGSGSITAPADINDMVAETPPPPRNQPENLGAPTGVSPGGTAEYCLTGIPDCDLNGWIANDGTNAINVPLTQTINTLVVDWRSGGGAAFDTQNVTVTVNDTIPPTIVTTPMDVSFDVDSVTEDVCFSTNAIGHLTASDVWDPAPVVEYSLDGFTYFPTKAPADDCSADFPPGTSFGPDANTVFWRATDTAGNQSTYQQTVTLNLPSGIVGKPCTVDLDHAGLRNTAGDFIMRDPTGAQVGTTDTGVTGVIDTTLLCPTEICSDVGATLEAGQPFQSLLWFADPITLFGPGTWQFNACPGDASKNCDGPPQPRLLDMTVKTAAENGGVQQLGAHMLFEWGTTQDIDVVVVWDVDCGTKQLTTTDPDGDGILGTKMVDGPFIGFNAAFDVSATGVDPDGNPVPLIAEGGYTVSIPAYRNPTPNSSPLELNATEMSASDFPPDSSAVAACVGSCYTFDTDGVINGTDANGAYQYVQVVLPLNEPIPFWSLYRKFDPASQQWVPFVLDGRNDVKSAPFDENGACPEPGAGDYKVANDNSLLANKLQENDNCIQLTIEDNGPNDSNPAAGTVEDPSGVAEVAAPPLPDPETEGDYFDSSGGCTISKTEVVSGKHADWWLLGGFLAWLGTSLRRKRLD